jgi:hypothetical protein
VDKACPVSERTLPGRLSQVSMDGELPRPVQTIPGRRRFSCFRLYGPLQGYVVAR